MATCWFLVVVVYSLWTSVLINAKASNRLIGGHEKAKLHRKHHDENRQSNTYNDEYAAAAVMAAHSEENDEEMGGMQLGDATETSWPRITVMLKKHTTFRKEMRRLAAWAENGEGMQEAPVVLKRDEECKTICDTQVGSKNSKFQTWAECYASCWYVADGNMAGLSIGIYRNKYKTFPTPTGKLLTPYHHYMRYLYDATHRSDRFAALQQAYKEQQALFDSGKWNGDIPFKNAAWDDMVADTVKRAAEYKAAGKQRLFVWRGLGKIIIPQEITDEKALVLWGPTSTSLGVTTPYHAATSFGSFGAVGTIIRIEIPVDMLEATDNAVRGGHSVEWIKQHFGLINIEANKYADSAHMSQREILLYNFPWSWIKVQKTFGVRNIRA